MTGPNDPLFDQRIADWLEHDPDHAPVQALEVVLAAVPSIRQRHAWRAPRRFLTMPMFTRVAAAAVIGALALGGTLFLIRPGQPAVGGGPNPAPGASSSQPAVSQPAVSQPAVVVPSPTPSVSPRPSNPATPGHGAAPTITLGAFGNADGPGNSVSDAIANAGLGKQLVNGILLKETDGTIWLCEMLLGSSPEQCAEPRLLVENSDPAVQTFDAADGAHIVDGVRWLDRVQLFGVVDPSPAVACVNPPPDIAALSAQTDPVACYGKTPLTVDAHPIAAEIDYFVSVKPAWLGTPSVQLMLVRETRKVGAPFLIVAVDPATGASMSEHTGTNVRITGHFDDPAAQTCLETGRADALETPDPAAVTIERCRRTFVVTQVVPLQP